jgi:hypothetical protein
LIKHICFSSLRLLCVLRCLGGDIKSGFGGLGRGMSSALVGGGYGWDGWVVCFGGGVFSWCGWLGRVWGVCLWGVRGVIVESVCWVGVRVGLGEVGRKKTYYLVAPFEIADFRGE